MDLIKSYLKGPVSEDFKLGISVSKQMLTTAVNSRSLLVTRYTRMSPKLNRETMSVHSFLKADKVFSGRPFIGGKGKVLKFYFLKQYGLSGTQILFSE